MQIKDDLKKEIIDIVLTAKSEFLKTLDIIKLLTGTFKVSERTAYRYLELAENELKINYDADVKKIININFERLERIMRKENAKEKPDYLVILKAIDLQNKLKGVYTQKIELDNKFKIADDDPLREIASKIIGKNDGKTN